MQYKLAYAQTAEPVAGTVFGALEPQWTSTDALEIEGALC